MNKTERTLVSTYTAAVFAAILAAFQPMTVNAAAGPVAASGGLNLSGMVVIAIIVLLCIMCMLIAVIYLSSEKQQDKRHRKSREAGRDKGAADPGENRRDWKYGAGEDEAAGYDENTGYDEAAGYDENTGYDEAAGYDEDTGYDEAAGYGDTGYDEAAGYDEDTGYDEAAGYDEADGYDWDSEYDDAAGDALDYGFEEGIIPDSEAREAKEVEAGGEQEGNKEPESDLPVIRVDNVTMKFKVAASSASGLKDYLIQRIKKQITTRDLLALDGVSFDIFKGEVVGIIGTNGSGKSTLLKIVSGAMEPTAGQVVVDKSKIQLLTLGTGFDMELSARENVYLNGAIIGYPKEFIDGHFDEIVAFAELEGFMDTKVKNFSSGMVSRLGFAIATAGDAAEILILDEVLSVGDEFFRQKSLKRIKEMIHGGSTVVMVSHGMGTILENCTKVVWIEKGVLQMVGDARTVCREYQKMGKALTV